MVFVRKFLHTKGPGSPILFLLCIGAIVFTGWAGSHQTCEGLRRTKQVLGKIASSQDTFAQLSLERAQITIGKEREIALESAAARETLAKEIRASEAACPSFL